MAAEGPALHRSFCVLMESKRGKPQVVAHITLNPGARRLWQEDQEFKAI